MLSRIYLVAKIAIAYLRGTITYLRDIFAYLRGSIAYLHNRIYVVVLIECRFQRSVATAKLNTQCI